MKRFLAGSTIALLTLLSVAAPAGGAITEDLTPGEHLGGYDTLSGASAFSFQPFVPALVSTGDVPFEGTVAFSSSRVKSGGISFGRSAFLWPGATAADMGPVLGVAFGQPEAGALIPKWPLQAQANQDAGEVKTGVEPIVAMRALGQGDRSESDARIADINIPNLIHIEHIASTSNSVVTDSGVTSTGRVLLEGVSLLNGHIKAEQIRSISETSSIGSAASASGDVDISGLVIGGFKVSVTDEGFVVDGLPEGAQDAPGAGEPVPGQSPEEAVNAVLSSIGARITLFKGISSVTGGHAQRQEPGIIISLDNPVGGQGPIPQGRFDIFLASSSASSFGTIPFSFSEVPTGDTPPVTEGGGSITIGSGPKVGGESLTRVGEDLGSNVAAGPGLLGTSPDSSLDDVVQQSGDYRFGGLPIAMVIGLLLLAALVARYVRNLYGRILPAVDRDEGEDL
jgi:hypothetical protein